MPENTGPELIASGTRDAMHARADGSGNVNQFRFDLGAPTLIVVILLLLIVAANGVVMGLNLSKQAQEDSDFKTLKTQEWLLERRLMDKEALDLVHGQRLQSDAEYGPTGNLQRMRP